MDGGGAGGGVAWEGFGEVLLELQLVGYYVLDIHDFKAVRLGKKFGDRAFAGFAWAVYYDVEGLGQFRLLGEVFSGFEYEVRLVLLILKEEDPACKLSSKLGLSIDQPAPVQFHRIHNPPRRPLPHQLLLLQPHRQ